MAYHVCIYWGPPWNGGMTDLLITRPTPARVNMKIAASNCKCQTVQHEIREKNGALAFQVTEKSSKVTCTICYLWLAIYSNSALAYCVLFLRYMAILVESRNFPRPCVARCHCIQLVFVKPVQNWRWLPSRSAVDGVTASHPLSIADEIHICQQHNAPVHPSRQSMNVNQSVLYYETLEFTASDMWLPTVGASIQLITVIFGELCRNESTTGHHRFAVKTEKGSV